MKTTPAKAALLALFTLVAVFAIARPHTRPAEPVVAAAAAVPASAVLQERSNMDQQRASRSRPLILPTRISRRPVRKPVPVKVVAQTRTPVRVVPPKAQPSAVSFTNQEMRVRSCESGPNGSSTNGEAHDFNYSAENASSTASGAWQFVDGTWNDFMGYSHAASAPRSVQDLKARHYIDTNGLTAWDASRSCWGG